ncbi:MAG: recombinase family protein, partial [Oscillospiraceae bacterium]|nr:recombinase family protein [Oscillospiraceae bacterium]
ALKSRKALLLEQQSRDSATNWRVDEAVELLSEGTAELTEWDESVIRQLVETVKVISKEKILVTLQGGIQIEQDMV